MALEWEVIVVLLSDFVPISILLKKFDGDNLLTPHVINVSNIE